MHYERGENKHLPDMLSWAYLPYKGKEVADFESVNMVHYLLISDQCLDEIRAETGKDKCLQELSETIPKKICRKYRSTEVKIEEIYRILGQNIGVL